MPHTCSGDVEQASAETTAARLPASLRAVLSPHLLPFLNKHDMELLSSSLDLATNELQSQVQGGS